MVLLARSGWYAVISIVAVCVLAPATESAAQVLEEIIVTAQKRAEDLSHVPISVTVVSGVKIREAGIQHPEELSAYVPNFTVARAPIADFINIRGVQSGGEWGFEQSVAMFVGDIHRGRGAQSRWSFVDIERVEVLRGPQTTLFGNNAIAGAVNISPARPTEQLDAALSIAYNLDFEETELQGHVSGPLSENVSGRLTLLSRQMDNGWVLNTAYAENNPVKDELFGRVSLEWGVNDSTLVTFRYESGEFRETGQPWVILEGGPLGPIYSAAGVPVGRGFQTTIGNNGFSLLGFPSDPVIDFGSAAKYDANMQEAALKIEYSLSNGALFTGIAGYSSYDLLRFSDIDFGPMPIIRFDDTDDFEQSSVELRLTSEAGGEIQYIAGLFVQERESYVDGLSQFGLIPISTLLSNSCAGLPGAPANIVIGDAVATAIGVAGLPGATAAVANACAQTALAEALVPQGVTGIGRYNFLDQSSDSIAAFAQMTWKISDRVRTTLGLRYTDEGKSASQGAYATGYAARATAPLDDQSPANPQALASFVIAEFTPHQFVPTDPGMSRSDDDLTWSLNAQWDVSGNAMLYASATTGFKAGGFNSFYMGLPQAAGANSLDVAFEPEEVLSFEIGAKLSFLDGSASLDIAAFHMSYEDLQVLVFSGDTTFIVQNAAEATTSGIEIEGRWQATDNLMLQAAIGLLDSKYDAFANQGCTAEQFLGFREAAFQTALAAGDEAAAGVASLVVNNQVCAAAGINDMRGRPGAHSPDWTASLVADYRVPIGRYELTTAIDVNLSDDVYRTEDLDPLSLQDGYTKVNAMLSLGPIDGNWDIALVGKNLTDEVTISFENDTPLFDGAHEARIDPPRSIAIRGRLRF